MSRKLPFQVEADQGSVEIDMAYASLGGRKTCLRITFVGSATPDDIQVNLSGLLKPLSDGEREAAFRMLFGMDNAARKAAELALQGILKDEAELLEVEAEDFERKQAIATGGHHGDD